MQWKFVSSIKDISAIEWSQLTSPNNPFFDYEFFAALEEGRCLDERTGWIPRYLLFTDKQQLVATIPTFIKTHSYGEFIFDFQFAQAYHQHGLNYYPKLVCAVPVTPVSGQRILYKKGYQFKDIKPFLEQAFSHIQETEKISSIHFLYCLDQEAHQLEKTNFLRRRSFEFHWHNQGYQSFDDFLQALNHKCRQQIKKERREALSQGLQIERITGNDLTEHHMQKAYEFYLGHHHYKYGSQVYLTQDFFQLVAQKMADRILLILIKKQGEYVGGSTNFYKGKGIYGRYWGHSEPLKFLHFEACYYQQIEFAIRNKMKIFEAGAQGQHKIKRGLIPQDTHSVHWFAHQGFHQAIAQYLPKEADQVEKEQSYYSQRSPYKIQP